MSNLMDAVKGYKTITSAIVVAVVAVLQYLKLIDAQTAAVLFQLAAALGLYGIHDAVVNPADDTTASK